MMKYFQPSKMKDVLDEFYFRWFQNSFIDKGKAEWNSLIFNHLNWKPLSKNLSFLKISLVFPISITLFFNHLKWKTFTKCVKIIYWHNLVFINDGLPLTILLFDWISRKDFQMQIYAFLFMGDKMIIFEKKTVKKYQRN